MHLAKPTPANVPATQTSQLLMNLERNNEDDVPATQGVHGVNPVRDHMPPGHCSKHLSSESEPAEEDNELGHGLHSRTLAEPVLGLNVSCGQFSQSCLDVDPTTLLNVPAWHRRHAACEAAPVISL